MRFTAACCGMRVPSMMIRARGLASRMEGMHFGQTGVSDLGPSVWIRNAVLMVRMLKHSSMTHSPPLVLMRRANSMMASIDVCPCSTMGRAGGVGFPANALRALSGLCGLSEETPSTWISPSLRMS